MFIIFNWCQFWRFFQNQIKNLLRVLFSAMNSGGFMGGPIHPAAVHVLASRKRKFLDQVKLLFAALGTVEGYLPFCMAGQFWYNLKKSFYYQKNITNYVEVAL